MNDRVYEDKRTGELYKKVWNHFSQTLVRKDKGKDAILELLYRFNYLPDGYWDFGEDGKRFVLESIPFERAFVTLQYEANERGIDWDATLEKNPEAP